MPLVTVSEAAKRLGRSSQWVRDRIHDRTLPGYEQPAGTRKRLLVAEEDLERLIAGLRVEPVSPVRAPPPVREQPPVEDVETAQISWLMHENERLTAENERLTAENRQLKTDNLALWKMAKIGLDRFEAAFEATDATES